MALRLLTLIYGRRGRGGRGMKSFNGSHPTAPPPPHPPPFSPGLLSAGHLFPTPTPTPTPPLSFAISVLAILMSTDECRPYEGHPSSNRILNYPRRYTGAFTCLHVPRLCKEIVGGRSNVSVRRVDVVEGCASAITSVHTRVHTFVKAWPEALS